MRASVIGIRGTGALAVAGTVLLLLVARDAAALEARFDYGCEPRTSWCGDLTCTFDASESQGAVAGYRWYLQRRLVEDRETETFIRTGVLVTHTFTSVRCRSYTYSATLEVLDAVGNRHLLTKSINPSRRLGDPTPSPTAASTPAPTAIPTPVATASEPVVLIRTTSLVLRDDAVAPLDPRKRRMSFRSSARKLSPSGVVVPSPGTPQAPTVSGATVVVYRPGGTPGDARTLALPASNWVEVGTVADPGYRYADVRGLLGPIRRATLRAGKLEISGQGEGLHPLAGAPQGEMALRFELGGGLTMCAAAPAREPAASNDDASRFVAEPHTPAPLVCPEVP